jgi:oxygen-independent coproporphyrinogen III oxidase
MIPGIFEDIPRELVERFEQAGPYAIAFPATNGSRLTPAQYAAALKSVADRPADPVSLYVHIPFCPVRCLYCACHTTVTHDAERVDRYLDILAKEMDMVAAALGPGRELAQLHLGGGTPNYLSDSQLVRLVEDIHERFRIQPDTATSIECNPRRASAGQLELLHELGFKDVSFGIQDLEPRVQHAIGRINSFGMVQDICANARELGFDHVSLDLIYGLPNQTEQTFEKTLQRIVETEPDRVRFYSYSHRPSLRPHQHAIEAGSLPTPAQKLTLLHTAVRLFTESGYRWLGTDWFVREGDELAEAHATGSLRHNCLGFTTAPTRHLIALGTSGMGEVAGTLAQNEYDIEVWATAIRNGRFPIAWGHKMSDADRRRREVLQHLLCNLEFPTRLAVGLEEDYGRLSECARHGLVEVAPDGLRITHRGRFFLRNLCTPHELSTAWSGNQWGIPRIA